jgi:hypothetical protein
VLAVNSSKKGRSFGRNNITRKSGGQEGITVEKNNGYVVLKCNIYRYARKYNVVERGRHYSARSHLFLQQASRQIIKNDVNVFLPRIFASWRGYRVIH